MPQQLLALGEVTERAEALRVDRPGLPKERRRASAVVVRTEIDYRKGAKLGDNLQVEGWLDRLERVRFWCGFRIVRSSDQAVIVECRQMLALVEMPAAKLLRLPEDWEKYRQPEAVAG